ncbi:MAG TPA: lysophospholipid acyltransferase family protein, partial [Kiritimatiellia bacterium]|nr:lysophospholipid acyltransferase family protein [Kiritimatiellia bacterium]
MNNPSSHRKPAHLMRQLRKPFEIAAATLAFAILPRLPRPAIVHLSRFLGRAAYLFSAKQRRIGRANLDLVYRDTLSSRQKNTLLIRSLQTFALAILDSLWFSRHSHARLQRWITMDPGYDPLLEPRRALCITAHMGSWEAIGLALSARGVSLSSIANPLKNPQVNRHFVEKRKVTGQQVIPRAGAARGILKELREERKVALVLDQNVLLSEGGIFIDFFGLPVTASPIAGALALKTDTPIVLGFCLPDPRGHYHCIPPTWIYPADLTPDPHPPHPAAALTRHIYRIFEQTILAHPHA